MRRLVRCACALVLVIAVTVSTVRRIEPSVAAAGPGTPVADGYWLVAADGGIFSYGAAFHGSMGGRPLQRQMVGAAATPSGGGYWTVASDGGIFAFGDARFAGSTGGLHLNRPIVGMAATPSGAGYWLVASDGGIFSFGDAGFYGSTGGAALRSPIVGMTASPTGRGYWLVASDGGIFSFGDATFAGSAGGRSLSHPVVGMASSGTGRGYWLVTANGAVLPFGDASSFGSAAGMPLSAPVVGMTALPRGLGYWLVAADGGVFTYGEAPNLGSAGGSPLQSPVVAMAAPPVRLARDVSIFYYPWYGTGPRDGEWFHWDGNGHTTAPTDINADDYPARGPYSSNDPAVVDDHMAEIAAAGVTTVVSSWWGRGSYEDRALPGVVAAATARGLRVAAHVEPYANRTPESVADDLARLRSLGVREAWVYDAMAAPTARWFETARRFQDMTLYLHTNRLSDAVDGDLARYARLGGFDGIYSYDAVRYGGRELAALCGTARRYRILCSPSVAPGFSGRRIGLQAFADRAGGQRYEQMWSDATVVGGDTVSITSYNEWHEGTGIEPARPYCFPDGWCSAGWDDRYLRRTAAWSGRFRSRGAG